MDFRLAWEISVPRGGRREGQRCVGEAVTLVGSILSKPEESTCVNPAPWSVKRRMTSYTGE